MELTWLLIAALTITGWGGFLGWSLEHIDRRCEQRNLTVLDGDRQGPLQVCDGKDFSDRSESIPQSVRNKGEDEETYGQ